MQGKIGDLVVVRVNFQLSRNIRIKDGDYGIIIGYPTEESNLIFDYLVSCNGITIYLFKNELQLVSK